MCFHSKWKLYAQELKNLQNWIKEVFYESLHTQVFVKKNLTKICFN